MLNECVLLHERALHRAHISFLSRLVLTSYVILSFQFSLINIFANTTVSQSCFQNVCSDRYMQTSSFMFPFTHVTILRNRFVYVEGLIPVSLASTSLLYMFFLLHLDKLDIG